MFRADIHCHSTFSDGTDSPKELIDLALKKNFQGFSITDHDSVEAYQTAIPLAKEKGLALITGVEFSCMHGSESVHILGYSFDYKHPSILAFCQKHHERRLNRNREILKKLADHQMFVTEEEINALLLDLPKHARTIGRPHIAQVMMQKGYVSSVVDAFKKYIGEGKPCFAPGESYSVEETIDIIHEAKGYAVIAHPHLLPKGKLLNQLLELKFDGLECYYGRFPLEKHSRFLKLAEKKGLIVTGGSDYHGTIKPDIPLGCSFIPQESFQILLKRFEDNFS